MKKVLLIGDSPIYDSPYINNYIEIFNRNGIEYDLLYWNRHMDDTSNLPSNHIPYNKYTEITYPFWRKIFIIGGFARFVKNHLRTHQYEGIVVFTIAHAIFMESFLCKWYKGRFVWDIRDYSPLCKLKLLDNVMQRLVTNSVFTVVSSSGFLKWLPKEDQKYIVNHNTTLELIKGCNIDTPHVRKDGKQNILTIGQLRDKEANIFIIKSLANKHDYHLNFSGSGCAMPILQRFVKDHNVDNATFTGRYQKHQELDIIRQSDIINSFMGDDINSKTLMSNRFYNAVLCCKPLIVKYGSFQSEICEKYDLGIVVSENDDLALIITNYIKSFDCKKYLRGRTAFMDMVKSDLLIFENKIVETWKSN